jgi:TPR repeat protein
MSYIDCDSLAQFEREARNGRSEALYNLGLAYSTGQGVSVDFIAAHKWFNLAAMRGVGQARGWRAQISREMTAGEIAEAQRQAREWLSQH